MKLDSGWPNVGDYSVPLPDQGEWQTVRIPVRDILSNSNRYSPGAFADIRNIANLVVLEQQAHVIDVDNIRFEINPALALRTNPMGASLKDKQCRRGSSQLSSYGPLFWRA